MADIAFKPLIKYKETPAEIERIDNSELSNYKEKGVEFQGFSKVKIGEKQYRLLRQDWGSRHNVFGWAGSNASLTLTINAETATKTFYITNLILTGVSSVNTLFLLAEVGGDIINLFDVSQEDPDHNTLNINFRIPLPFTRQTLEIMPLNPITGAPLVITGHVVINYYGYFEQKS